MPPENPLFITAPGTLDQQERALFATLAAEPHRVFTKAELLRALHFNVLGNTRRLDAIALRLRRKLRDFDGRRSPQNVWGVGYRLMDPPEAS